MATSLPPLWVYKCNAVPRPGRADGDWDEFFAGPQPAVWGGTHSMRSNGSLSILRHRMRPGDLVLCWQTNKRAAVGLCRVSSLDDWQNSATQGKDMVLELIGEPFSPPAPLLERRKSDARLAKVRAFQQGFAGTLYETTAGEARTLLRACGVSTVTLPTVAAAAKRPGPLSGGGFGTAAENAKVEAAAVKAFRHTYKSWTIEDLQVQNVGYDFRVSKGSAERHVEVKGVRGPMPSFLISENEVTTAKADAQWRVYVVTDALSVTPQVKEWTRDDFLRDFWRRPITTYMARLK